jgi:fucose 4-O-acetylase-like acetyltransferase
MKNYKYSRNNYKSNLGIEILRMILCFWVITFHFAGNSNKVKYKILQTFYHVPTFMLISFYFSYKAFISNDIIKYKMRLERLLIPYIIWPIIFLSISISFDSINIKKLIYTNINIF